VEKRRAELIQLLYKFVRFSDIVKFFIRRMLNNDLCEILANMPLQSVRRAVTDLNGQAKGGVI
jgi:hypothetical protein